MKKEITKKEYYGCDVHPYFNGRTCKHGSYRCVECKAIHGDKCSVCIEVNEKVKI